MKFALRHRLAVTSFPDSLGRTWLAPAPEFTFSGTRVRRKEPFCEKKSFHPAMLDACPACADLPPRQPGVKLMQQREKDAPCLEQSVEPEWHPC